VPAGLFFHTVEINFTVQAAQLMHLYAVQTFKIRSFGVLAMGRSISAIESRTATIRAGALSGLAPLLAARGARGETVYERSGLDPALLSQPECRIDIHRYLEVLNRAAGVTGDLALGARLGYEQSLGGVALAGAMRATAGGSLSSLGLVGEIAWSAETIGDAVRAVSGCIFLHQEGASLQIDVDGQHAMVVYQGSHADPEQGRQDVELSLAKMLGFARLALGSSHWAPSAVHFRHRKSGPRADAAANRTRALFAAPVGYGQQRDAIVFPRALLDVRIRVPAAERAMRGENEPADLLAWLRSEIYAQLESGAPSAAAVAARLGLGERSLQRRLQSRGLAFNTVVEDIRHGLARRLLDEGRLSMTEISERLGYSEQSAFSRAFRRWAGCSPQAHRQRAVAMPNGIAESGQLAMQ
jgi:AraC-like DNA-binding protein